MSAPRVGSKEFLHLKGIKAWANIPRERVLRNMTPDKCLETRFQFALILWSWCGPEPSETVVKKNENGWIVRDGAGQPVRARLRDFAEMLGVGKANITRVAQLLIKRGELRYEGRNLVLTLKPQEFDKPANAVVTNSSWNIAGVVVS